MWKNARSPLKKGSVSKCQFYSQGKNKKILFLGKRYPCGTKDKDGDSALKIKYRYIKRTGGQKGEITCLHLRHSHEPAGDGPVDQRGLWAPAEGVGVLHRPRRHQTAHRLQVLYDILVRVLHILAYIFKLIKHLSLLRNNNLNNTLLYLIWTQSEVAFGLN